MKLRQSLEGNKDRDNRDENHKDVHLGLQTVEIHPHTQLNSQKKAQAPKELELFNRWFKPKLTTYQMVKNILAQNGEKIPKVFGLLQIFSLAQNNKEESPAPL